MNIYRRGHKPLGRLENTMNRWSKKELEQLDNITFAIAILNERRQNTTNPYSLLNQKISEAVRELEKTKEQRNQKANRDKYIAIATAEDYQWFGFGTTEETAKQALVNQYNEFYNDNRTVEGFERIYSCKIDIAVWIDGAGYLTER